MSWLGVSQPVQPDGRGLTGVDDCCSRCGPGLRGDRSALFYTGSAYGTYAKVGSVVKSGPSAPVTFGCSINGGLHKTNTTAGLNLPPLAKTGTIATTGDTYASPIRSRTSATTNQVNLLNGLVRATAVKAVSSTTRSSSGFALSSSGTTLTGLVVGGVSVRADAAPNTRINLAGYGYLVVNEQTKRSNGLRVSGLRLSVSYAPLSADRRGRPHRIGTDRKIDGEWAGDGGVQAAGSRVTL